MRENASPVDRHKSRRARTSCPLRRDWALGNPGGRPPREHITDLKQKGLLRPTRMDAAHIDACSRNKRQLASPKGSEGNHAPGIHPPSCHSGNPIPAAEGPYHLRFEARSYRWRDGGGTQSQRLSTEHRNAAVGCRHTASQTRQPNTRSEACRMPGIHLFKYILLSHDDVLLYTTQPNVRLFLFFQ